jgi:LysR family transcriptional regulator, transcriptional activator of nhaA
VPCQGFVDGSSTRETALNPSGFVLPRHATSINVTLTQHFVRPVFLHDVCIRIWCSMPGKLHDLNYLHLLYFWTVAREGSMTAACKKLDVTQPTISMQIRKLEQSLGHKLFERVGRGIELTETGRTVFDYAEDIFSLGRALVGALNGQVEGRQVRLTVGIPHAMPKLITYRLLEPVLADPDRVQLICHEADLTQLIAGLAVHRYDVIISDMPIAPGARVRSFNHPLGECPIAICGTKSLVNRYRRDFPRSLHRAPMLLPTPNTDMRRSLDRWFAQQEITPRIVAEFDDSALLKEFGQGGWGVFPVPAAVVKEVKKQYSVQQVGILEEVRARYFAITTERKLKNPAVVTIAEAAKDGLLES